MLLQVVVALFYVGSSVAEKSGCVTLRRTDPSSEEGLPCVFPFTYQGKKHNTCTVEGHQRGISWCSTLVDDKGEHVEGEGNWGICSSSCPQEPGCPSDWLRLGKGCYKFPHKYEGSVTLEKAKSHCEEMGGFVLEINSEEENTLLRSHLEKVMPDKCMYQGMAFWLGFYNSSMREGSNSSGWRSYKDETPVTFINKYDTEPAVVEGAHECTAVLADKYLASDAGVENFKWVDLPCNEDVIPFPRQYIIRMQAICEREAGGVVVVEPERTRKSIDIKKDSNECLDGWTKLSTGCYMFKEKPSTWIEARQICHEAGGYLAEIQSDEEFKELEELWQKMPDKGICPDNHQSWWLGLNDRKEEGTWEWDFSEEAVDYSAWHAGEPQNHGGKVPGEDCVVATLGYLVFDETFQWYDVSCYNRGFPTKSGQGVSFNPLCEQYPINNLNSKRLCEGCSQQWISIGEKEYKFIKRPEGTTQEEAEKICEENGGFLAEPTSSKEFNALRDYFIINLDDSSSTSFFSSLFGLFSATPVKYAWRIGATDEKAENHWKWKKSGGNVTYDEWFKVFEWELPDNGNTLSYGGADCALVAMKNDIMKSVQYWPGEKTEKYIESLQNGGNFKWIDLPCYDRIFEFFEMSLSPICERS